MQINEERGNLYRVLDGSVLPDGVAGKLAGLGITTLDELRDHWSYGNRQLITRPNVAEVPLTVLSFVILLLRPPLQLAALYRAQIIKLVIRLHGTKPR